MHSIKLFDGEKSEIKVLCLGAHGDDLEIGCCGTLMKLLEDYGNISVCWIVFSSSGNGDRRAECEKSANELLGENAVEIEICDYRDGFFPYHGCQIKDYFENLKSRIDPDVIFTHHREDLHQDHRVVSELTWNTFRNHLILEYEIVKYDGGLGSPNLFVPISSEACEKKIDHLLGHFPTQESKQWFRKDVFMSMLSIRGIECNSPSGYAEAYYSQKMVI